MLEIKDLQAWLPEEVIELYLERGIKELYPPQAEAVERGLLDGKNMLLAIPTAAGKTLLAELAMLKAALAGKRSLYIVPLRALASEKFEAFSRFRRLGITVGISTGDFDRRDERLGKNLIIIATSEKADSLMRTGASWIKELGVLVADEIHLLNSANRGPTLEMTLTKLVRLNPEMQIIGLSATVANAQEMADWLQAELVSSDWRPITLREGVILRRKMSFVDQEVPLRNSGDEVLSLVKDTLEEGAQILIFENSRRNAEATAIKLGQSLSQGSADLAEKITAAGESESARRLASCVSRGTAFHHAGLLPEQRRMVEDGFRNNLIKVIASTPTLAAGLNLPARRVLIKSYKRYESGQGMIPIPVMEYRQMAGRAGRPGLDPYGESLLMARSQPELQELMGRYIFGQPEEIWSKLASESALRTHLLSTVASGFASSIQELKDFIATTFYAHQQDPWRLDVTLERVLAFLEESGMITCREEDLRPTRLGSLVSKLYIDPLGARIMVDRLRALSRPPDLSLIHLITMTPNMELLYVNQSDCWLEEFIDEHVQELNPEENYDFLLRQVKTTSLLLDWINEVREEDISARYRIGPGDVRRVAETAEWLMHATAEISKHLELGVTFQTQRLSQRIHYGAGPDLLTLLELKGVGRVRARKLFQAGYTSLDRLRSARPEEIAAILGPRIGERVAIQLRESEETVDHWGESDGDQA